MRCSGRRAATGRGGTWLGRDLAQGTRRRRTPCDPGRFSSGDGVTEPLLRLLVVSQYFWPETFRVNDLASELRSRGHEVTVLTGQPNYPGGDFFPGYGGWRPTWERWSGCRILRVPLVPRRGAEGLRLGANYLSFALSACTIGTWKLRNERPDAILVFEPSPLTVALPGLVLRRLLRAPAALWVQDLWPDTLFALRPVRSRVVVQGISRFCAGLHRRMDCVFVQSQAFVEPLLRHGVRQDRLRYLPNWAEALYNTSHSPTQYARPSDLPDGFLVMFAGNLGRSQALETIIDAAERLRGLPDLHWVILGDGRRSSWLARRVREQGLSDHIHLLGRRPTEAMPEYFMAADVLLVTLRPDRVYEMTIPSKLQSYLAAGKPIVGSLNGEGARVILESKAGYAGPAGDGAALSAAVERMYRLPPADRAAMGDRARTYYKAEFERDLLVSRVEDELVRLGSSVA